MQVLQIAPSTWHARAAVRTDPDKRSNRAKAELHRRKQALNNFTEDHSVEAEMKPGEAILGHALSQVLRHAPERHKLGIENQMSALRNQSLNLSGTTIGMMKSEPASVDSRATDLTEGFFRDIERRRDLNAYLTLNKEGALKQAEASDQRRREGRALPLDGIPLAIKDNFCTEGLRTTAGSKILEDFTPTYESGVTQRLLDAGAVILGKTNMDEFGMGSSTENSAFGPTINPHRLLDGTPVVPGGSSGGSAAAVAANLCIAALGTDTGGSLRQPAAFCGVIGFKPTYGLCSRWGMIAYASSFDQAGVITKTVSDAAIIMDVIAGHDPKDSTSVACSPPRFEQKLATSTPHRRIGIPREMREAGSNEDLDRLWAKSIESAKDAGHSIIDVSLPHLKYSLPAYYILVLSEASSNLARYDGVRYGYRAPNVSFLTEMYEQTRALGFGLETKKRILLGTFTLSAGYYEAYFQKAAKVRAKLRREFDEVFTQVDCLMWPTAPTSAFEFGSHSSDPVSMYLEDVFTVPVNLVGAPAISIPAIRCKKGLPMGLQLIGNRMEDAHLLQVASAMERAIQFQ